MTSGHMEPQLKRMRGTEEEEGKMGNNEEKRGNEDKMENNEEDDLAELDKFVISAMLAGVPFLKTKIKMFAKRKESRLKEKVDELGAELTLKTKRLNELEYNNESLRQMLKIKDNLRLMLKREKRRTEEIKENAKSRELIDKIEIESMNGTIEKLKMENNNLTKNLDKETTFTNRRVKVTSELTDKFIATSKLTETLKVEKDNLQKKLESAKVTIEKNLEKIAKLEARNLSLENNKPGQLSLGLFLKEENANLEEKEIKMVQNLGQGQSVKGEYQETAGNTTIKSEMFCSDKQILSDSDKRMPSDSDKQIQSESDKQIQSGSNMQMQSVPNTQIQSEDDVALVKPNKREESLSKTAGKDPKQATNGATEEAKIQETSNNALLQNSIKQKNEEKSEIDVKASLMVAIPDNQCRDCLKVMATKRGVIEHKGKLRCPVNRFGTLTQANK